MHRLFSAKKYFEQRCFKQLASLLPPRMREHLLYIYKKGETLYFVFKHPGFVMEFNYSKNHINELLKMLQKEHPECQELQIRTLKSYHKFTIEEEVPTKPKFIYTEQARGEFEIRSRNQQLKELLEKIKEAIRKNAASAKDS